MNEPPQRRRSDSVGRTNTLQSRAGNFVRKLGFGRFSNKFATSRSERNLSRRDREPEGERNPYGTTRSMDVARKPFMSQPVLSLDIHPQRLRLGRGRRSADDSSQSHSQSRSTPLGLDGDVDSRKASMCAGSVAPEDGEGDAAAAITGQLGPQLPAPAPTPSPSTSRKPDGLDATASEQSSAVMPSSATASASHSGPSTDGVFETSPPTPIVAVDAEQGSASQNSVSEKAEPVRPPPPTKVSFATPPKPSQLPSASAAKRPVVPRLSTLPPLNTTALMETPDHRVRLSPSVVVRHPPFPIFTLPPLPTIPSAAEPSTPRAPGGPETSTSTPNPRARQVRLNTMPLLPREGRDERSNDPSHDEHIMDGDEEMEGDDDDDDMETETEHDHGRDQGSDDEDEVDIGTPGAGSGSGATVAASSSRLPFRLPEILLPKSTLASFLPSGLGFNTPSPSQSPSQAISGPTSVGTEGGVTPKVGTDKDYFSSGALVSSSEQGGPASPRTPTARDFSSSSHEGTAWGRHQDNHAAAEAASRAKGGAQAHAEALGRAGAKAAPTPVASMSPRSPAGASMLASPRPGMYHQASRSMVDLAMFAKPREPGMADAPAGAGSTAIGGAQAGSRDSRAGGVGARAAKGKSTVGTDAEAAALLTDKVGEKDDGAVKEHDKTNAMATTANLLDTVNSTAVNQSPLRRQRSMPTFTSAGPPPPYPNVASFLPEHLRRAHGLTAIPEPRDEEGREALPSYTNDIKLVAIMPRKMEFAAPGIPAKDRKWKRVHCVLEGTAFRVYRCPTSVSGVSAIGGWWERKVGVGDIALVGGHVGTVGGTGAGVAATVKRERNPVKWEQEEMEREREQERESEDFSGPASSSGHSGPSDREPSPSSLAPPPVQHKSKRQIAAAFLHPNFSRSRVSLQLHRDGGAHGPSPPSASPRSSLQLPRPSMDSSASGESSMYATSSSAASSSTYVASSSTSNSHSRSGFLGHTRNSGSGGRGRGRLPHSNSHGSSHSSNSASSPTSIPEPEAKNLEREYTLQHAESGLASDYFKRKNVIRVRMEGEQFLLQATDVAGVIEWIEGLQAATNVSLDLDERPMPRGPIFPRRRRRRRARLAPEGEAEADREQSAERS